MSEEPMLWLDGLDIPLVQFLDASFMEHGTDDEQPISRPEGDALARYGANMLPVDQKRQQATTPIFNYPYARSREALETMRRGGPWDPCHGLKMRYINPMNGDFAMPTMATCLQLLPQGFASSRYRSTDATVFTVVEGHGRTRVGETVLEWGPKDLFVVPSWKPVVHEATEDAVLFSFSDRAVQEKLGLWREDRGNVPQLRRASAPWIKVLANLNRQ
jgi:gentisate 1,2-dioxygenase